MHSTSKFLTLTIIVLVISGFAGGTRQSAADPQVIVDLDIGTTGDTGNPEEEYNPGVILRLGSPKQEVDLRIDEQFKSVDPPLDDPDGVLLVYNSVSTAKGQVTIWEDLAHPIKYIEHTSGSFENEPIEFSDFSTTATNYAYHIDKNLEIEGTQLSSEPKDIRLWFQFDNQLYQNPVELEGDDFLNVTVIPADYEFVGGDEDTPVTITHTQLIADFQLINGKRTFAGKSIVFDIVSVDAGLLTRNGIDIAASDGALDGNAVIDETTASNSIVWHPPADTSGVIQAFTIKYGDGNGWESGSIAVKVNVQPVTNTLAMSITGQTSTSVGASAISLDSTQITGTYAWSVVSKPADGDVQLSSTTIKNPTASFTEAGTYVLRVIGEASGDTGSDTIQIVVGAGAPPNSPAITMTTPGGYNIMPDTETGTVALQADATPQSGADVSDVQFHIYRGSNHVADILTGVKQGSTTYYDVDWTPGADGLYVIKAIVTNEDGMSTTAIKTVHINNSPYIALSDTNQSDQYNIGSLSGQPSSGTADDFGFDVALSGYRGLVGARKASNIDTIGHAHFLKPSGSTWIKEVANLGRGNFVNGDRYGNAVAMDGDWAAVSGPLHHINASNEDAGRIHIYRYNSGTSEWDYVEFIESPSTIFANQEDHRFGWDLAIDGNTLVIGSAPVEATQGEPDDGIVYVYELDPSPSGGTFGNTAINLITLVASNPKSEALFGSAVAIDGNTIAVGARDRELPQQPGSPDKAGVVYIYENNGSSWEEVRRFISPSAQADANFGFSVALSGSRLVVGEPLRDVEISSVLESDVGAAYVYKRSGDSWANTPEVEGEELIPTTEEREAGDKFGISVDVGARTVAVGASLHETSSGPSDGGIVYLFNDQDTQWDYGGYVLPHNAAANDQFGSSVAMSDGRMLVGAARSANPGYAVMFTQKADPVEISSPSSGAAYVYGDEIVLEVMAMDPADGGTTTVEFKLDGATWPGGAIYGTLDTATHTYHYTFPTSGAGTPLPGSYEVTAETGEGYVSDALTFYVYAPTDSTGTDVDGDGNHDEKELLYFGTLDANIDVTQATAIASGKDPLVTASSSQITSVDPPVGGTVAAPVSDAVIKLTINTDNTPLNSITIEDKFGNDITGNAGVYESTNGLEIDIIDFDPTPTTAYDSGSAGYLSGTTHEYKVILDDPAVGVPDREYTIYFHVDATLPTVSASRNGGRVSDASIQIELTASEPGTTIEYMLDGDMNWTTYSTAIQLDEETHGATVLTMRATDIAGNVGPESVEYYYFGNELNRVTSFFGGYNPNDTQDPDDNQIDLTWDKWAPPVGDDTPIVGYHVYRAINPVDVRRLKESLEKGYPPPHYLRITDDSLVIHHETITYSDTDITPDMTAWYGVTVTTADGNESVISDLAEVTTDAPNPSEPVISVAEATLRATNWLLANQAEEGYWGDDPDDRIVATSQALNALGRVDGVAIKHRDVIERGLTYLAGHFQDNNGAIARAADTLQRYGRDTTGLHTKLEFRSLKNSGTDKIQGWGLQARYYPDPLRTSLGAIARRTAGFGGLDMDDIKGILTATDMQSAIGTEDRYGWTTNNRDSVYVSALVYRATDQHRPTISSTTPEYNWVYGEQSRPNEDIGSFRDNILDTAGVLLYLPLRDASSDTDRTDAVEYLIDQQDGNGSWGSGPFLTGLCLEAIAERKVLHIYDTTQGDNNSNDAVAEMLEARGFTPFAPQTSGVISQSDIDQADLIVIAGDIGSSELSAPSFDLLRTAKVPLMVFNADLYPLTGLTGEHVDVDNSTVIESDELVYDASNSGLGLHFNTDNLNHPIYSGYAPDPNINIFWDNPTFVEQGWGIPFFERSNIARNTDSATSEKSIIFAYERGDAIGGGHILSARRVGFGLEEQVDILSDIPKAMLDAAFEWVTTPVNMP